jgi:diguanylate cyclase (GGDEF)-like protein
MTELLQSAATFTEAGEILSSYGGKFFQGDFGGVYVLNSTRDLVEPLAVWGVCQNEPFLPGDCWALRRGQPHLVRGHGDVKCPHVDDSISVYICVPMAAQHETLGVLHVGSTSPMAAASIEGKRAMAATMAAQVALALRNLQLREQLREMSIRDPLTALLNRRYLEESLSREISQAKRKELPIGVVMIDIDFFKVFNDNFGHEAGDTVLKELAHLFQKHVRDGDFACRMGGEEFILILPEATRELAFRRAEAIRGEIKLLQLASGAKALGVVTISAGIAAFPEDGDTCELLLAAADSALYLAKENGRDRVELYSPGAGLEKGGEPSAL